MTRQAREWLESPLVQGANESIVYALDISRWGTDPSSIVVTVYDETGVDVTSTVTDGSASPAGDVIYLPTIYHLMADIEYRAVVKFTIGEHVVETFGYIRAEA